MTDSNPFLDAQLQQVRIRDEEDRHSSCISRPRHTPPGWLLDKIAEEKLYGGWSPNRVCPDCNMALTDLGVCPEECGYVDQPRPRPKRRNIARSKD